MMIVYSRAQSPMISAQPGIFGWVWRAFGSPPAPVAGGAGLHIRIRSRSRR